jgi:Putative cyclase
MPHYPTHPPFLYSLTKKHGDIIYGEGTTAAADAIALGTHVGTHIDALSHFSCNGIFFGNRRLEHSYEHGMADLGVDTTFRYPPAGIEIVVLQAASVNDSPSGGMLGTGGCVRS